MNYSVNEKQGENYSRNYVAISSTNKTYNASDKPNFARYVLSGGETGTWNALLDGDGNALVDENGNELGSYEGNPVEPSTFPMTLPFTLG